MQYRKFGNIDFNVSALGFGGMRLPEDADKMLHYAIDQGVNYIDTAYYYQNDMNETVLGRILNQANYREKVKIATKLPCWLVQSQEDAEKFLDEQLKKLQTDHIDFYLLHALFHERWETVKEYRIMEWAQRAKEKGKIGHIGFSFHDSYEVFKQIINEYDQWEFCYIQYNYLNEDVQAGRKGLEYATKKGLPIVIMEPLLGGILANPPTKIRTLFQQHNMDPVEVALRWLWNKPEIVCVLSGMTSLEQVVQNIEIANRATIGGFSSQEQGLVELSKNLYQENISIPCTKCRYCLPCPNSVDIPFIFELFNEATTYEHFGMNKELYNYHIPDANKANACIQCGECEGKCPQKIRISDWMPIIHQKLSF